MIIGMDAKRAFCTRAGLGQYARRHIHAMVKHHPEWQFHLFSPHTPESEFLSEMEGHANVSIHTAGKTPPFYWRQWGIAPLCKKLHISLFHGLSNEIPSGLTCPSLLSLHDLIPFRDPSFIPLIQQVIYRIKMSHGIKNAKTIVCVSAFTQKDLARYFPKELHKSTVIRPFLGKLPAIQASPPLNRPYLLALGTLEARKNLGTLLEAFTELKQKIPHTLVLVGKEVAFTKALKAFAHNQGLGERVLFKGAASENEKWNWLHYADAVIYPSYLEGFGLPALEAIQANRPILFAQNTAVAEAAGPIGKAFETRNPGALAQSILSVLDSPEPYSQSEKNEHLNQFSEKNLVPQWTQAYESLLSV
jgi:glycosyltransferase involved in cell wall biosynthesis